MPRTGTDRVRAQERALVRRIKYERELRGWSPAKLAEVMTASGCKMHTSAVYKLEDTEKPRVLTATELIAAAKAFDMTLEELCVPIELVQKRRAQELIEELEAADERFIEGIESDLNALIELMRLAAEDRELYDFVVGHYFRPSSMPTGKDGAEPDVSLFSIEDVDGRSRPIDTERLGPAILEVRNALIEIAGNIVLTEVSHG